ncbi:hypothetical protein DUHN55_44690 [Helicobacter pylori]
MDREHTQPPLDDWQLGIYMREILRQADFAHLATKDLVASLQAEVSPELGTVRQFAALQSLLSAAALISKLLWCERGRDTPAFSKQRARQLREALLVNDDSTLKTRDVRNGFEHFDERLDRHLVAGKRHVIDSNIGPHSMIIINGESPLHLRLLDPESAVASVLDDKVNLNDLNRAITDLAEGVHAWLREHDQA